MSIVTPKVGLNGKTIGATETILTPDFIKNGKAVVAEYQPTGEEKEMRQMIVRQFTLGYTTMYQPRIEFNDLSVIERMQVDQMAFNTYQPNNGESFDGDDVNSWKSKAIRPVVRNKCISIAAHATARLIFPKVFAYNRNSDDQRHAAQVMADLMEWAADKSNYANTSLYRTITSLSDPASIGYTEYAETYRTVKRPDGNGGYTKEKIIDETLSCFQDRTVPVDELYIENIYEPDIQKQGWLIWRKVISFSLAEAKYKSIYPNFQYVKPGVQLIYNDANQSFYQVYDPHMRQYDVEEIIYWNRSLDIKIIMVNGVMLTTSDNPNPRNDKLYPFDKFGYEIINNRFFYYKSLSFKMQSDANIINTLYPMIVDGTYLNLMPPMINRGGEIIGSDVIVPGAVTTLSSPDANLQALQISNNLKAGQDALFKVEESINESSEDRIFQGQTPGGSPTAYQISRQEQNASTVLGLFVQMIAEHVRQFGKLRIGDILQYLTIADVEEIEGNPELVYKTFLLHDNTSRGRNKSRKVSFDKTLPSEVITAKDNLKLSYDTLEKQGGIDSKTELWRVNPELFRNFTYMISVSPDVLNPKSEDLERAYNLELYDRMIQNPTADQEEAFRLLLSTNPTTQRDPDKFITKGQGMMPPQPQGANAPQPNGSIAANNLNQSQLPSPLKHAVMGFPQGQPMGR